MLLKSLITLFVVITLFQLYRSYKNNRVSVFMLFFWGFTWIVLEIVVLNPYSTVYLANLLHFEFGINALVSLGLITAFYVLFHLYLKYEDLKIKLANAVRNQAIHDAERSQN